MSDDITNDKRALRAELRERRQLLTPAQLAAAEAGITEQLRALLANLGVRSLSCYLSARTEPSTRGFLNWATAEGIRVLLPVTRADGLLDWAVASTDGTETEGLFGLPEPEGELLGPIAVNDVDLMIVPAASIDRSGMRLGWGRGYFDKTLGSMENRPPVYAIVFDTEIVEAVPRELHDQGVTGAVTPTRTLTFDPVRH
ncbi:MAG: 5-formyltetrahydrofolate cyclo-ligase [Microbacteriaceae bacterium]|jgi:5-formyltetrahydrofolate cyclo-ligase|nr:5-formyltetrahydrofolate cyclo-ligase [Microbacteriaceae bacterium]HOA87366.1 5-formyltetrahydrofolate cyclo-ligase [Microbacteriaceae bacterium]HQC92638.1 5-formyltetrahydrofolate cyclo-ligase [Microbacteriaceae bacterium]